ncbi:pentapeptide repeat-containing protein [Legionella sp. WA2024007413]
MKKLNEYQIKKIYPEMSGLGGLINTADRLIPELRKLHDFCDTYGVPNDLFNEDNELFSSAMIHILLSLKKRINHFNNWMTFIDTIYKIDNLICIIVTQNELNEIHFRNHWAGFFLVCDELTKNIDDLFNKRLSGNRCTKDIDELCQMMSHVYAQIRELKKNTGELIILLNDSEFSKQQDSIAPNIPTNEHPFFSLPEEVKNSILSHLDIEDLISVQLTARNLSKTVATSMVQRFNKTPSQVIAHLTQIPPEKAYTFVEGYRRTCEYKALMSLVKHKMPMSDQEVVCYMLTRHHSNLPDIAQFRSICNASNIDEKTRRHLRILLQNAVEVDIARRADFSAKNPLKANELFALFLENYKKVYLNVLPSIALEEVNLAGTDVSYAPLSHGQMPRMDLSATKLCGANLSYTNLASSTLMKANLWQANLCHASLLEVCLDNAVLEDANLSHADLRYSTLRKACLKQANLRWADLSGATLDHCIIDAADFTGTNLAYAQLTNLDMRTIDVSQFNVEWTYLKNLRLVPDAALEHPHALENFFSSFEKNLESHTPGSQMKWRTQMLKDLKRLMSAASLSPEIQKLFLSKILTYYPPHLLSSTIFSNKHPFKKLFEQYKLITVDDSGDKVEHPLQAEVISILDRLQDRIDNTIPDMHIRFKKLRFKFNECVVKAPGITNVNQICQLSHHHFFLLQLFYFIGTNENALFKPYLVGYPQNNLLTLKHSQRYASQIFDGELFHLEMLQKIPPEQLNNYLYGDEDFFIKQSDRTLNQVKLGGLLISFTPGGKGSCFSKVEIIDFANRRLTFGFTIDADRYPSLKTELYLPIQILDDSMTHVECNLYADDIPAIRAALELRTNLTHYIFTTQKGPVPELNEKIKALALNAKVEQPLQGENRFGLYRQKSPKNHLEVSKKRTCVLI